MASSNYVQFDDWKCQGKMALDFLAFSVIQKREKNEEEMRSIIKPLFFVSIILHSFRYQEDGWSEATFTLNMRKMHNKKYLDLLAC